jgi:hypothetical protein
MQFDTIEDWVQIYGSAGLAGIQTETGPFDMITPRGFLADGGLARSAAIMGRVASRPVNIRKMAWLMPRMAKAVPYSATSCCPGRKPVENSRADDRSPG